MEKNYDVVVIGGGPAGMMAVGTAAQRGRRVLLLEKNIGLGKKLLITGGGRCNLTNALSLKTHSKENFSGLFSKFGLKNSNNFQAEPLAKPENSINFLSSNLEKIPRKSFGTQSNNKTEVRTMLSKYKGNDQFLFSAFAQFSVKDTLEFFNSRGLATKEENEGRIFPVSNSAKSVFDVLVKYMKEGNVVVKTSIEVTGIFREKEHIVIKTGGGNIVAAACVLATGGISRPETGSTGEGFLWLKNLGHTIIENDFSLVPIALTDSWVKKLGGVTLSDIKLTTFQNGQKQESGRGSVMFTHFGISGPLALNMSREIGELLKYGKVTLELDLFCAIDLGSLRKQLQELLAGEPNKKLKNVLGKLIPPALADALLKVAQIDGNTKNNLVSAEARKKLVTLMKAIPLNVSHLLGADKAVVSSGGVALQEVNFKTMQSRLIPNLYLVGDVLNIDRPSGGYSLQLCWTTGFVAGSNI